MKKFFSMMAAVAAMFVFASCGNDPVEGENKPATKTQLETPVVTVKEKGETSFTIEWEAVKNATSYMIYFDKNNQKTTAETSYTFTDLNAGTYKPRVKAIAEGYEDSEYSSVVEIVLTGLTNADWFTQTLAPITEPTELSDGTIVHPWNAVYYSWKGTGVVDIQYVMFATEYFESITKDEVLENMNTMSADQLAMVLPYINGEMVNDPEAPAEDWTGVFRGLPGNTSFTLCALVTNDKGVEYYTTSEITTAEVVIAEETKAWFGTWTVNAHEIYSINQQGEGTVSAQEETFTINITASEDAHNEVYVDGWSVMGLDAGAYTYGIVEENTLSIMNGTYLGLAEDGSFRYYWLGIYSDPVNFTIEAYPSNIATLAEDGNTAASTNKLTFYYEDGTPLEVTCYCSDVMGVADDGQVYFFIEDWPAVYRSGDMEWTKSEAAPATLNANARTLNPKSALKSSMVVAM
ncbi:MAG: fibronectin type III domain-containing protein [Alistipes sp.]|nr:fibronectin type III domain-containing protein [Alistipes sp.]